MAALRKRISLFFSKLHIDALEVIRGELNLNQNNAVRRAVCDIASIILEEKAGSTFAIKRKGEKRWKEVKFKL